MLRGFQSLLKMVFRVVVVSANQIHVSDFDISARNQTLHLIRLSKLHCLARVLLGLISLALFYCDAAQLKKNFDLLIDICNDLGNLTRLF